MGNPYLVIAAVALLLPSLCAGKLSCSQQTSFEHPENKICCTISGQEDSKYCENGTVTENEVNCQILTLINTRRSSVAAGNQYNGFLNAGTDDRPMVKLPPAKDMRKLTYNCTLEQQAADFLNSYGCKQNDDTTEPEQGYIFHSEYTFGDPVDMSDLIWTQISHIDSDRFSSVTEEGQPVKYSSTEDPLPLKTYANAINGKASQVGCTFGTCDNDGDEIVQLLCLTDAPNIKDGQQVYEMGTGYGCECTPPMTCDGSGLCVEPVTTTQATTVATSAVVTNGTEAPAAETTTLASLAEFPASSSAEPSTWCDWWEISDTMRMHMQDTHNFRRSTLALASITDNTGATLPGATNMNYLVWNCTLEREAHDFLKSCPTEGYQRPSDDLPAQNFYRGPITANEPTYRDMNKKTVTEWWKPVRKVAGPGQSAYFRLKHNSTEIRSYTLMGWAESRQMGCSIAKCGNDWVEACRYYPPGNKPDAQQYKPGKACSECNSLGAGPCNTQLGLCG